MPTDVDDDECVERREEGGRVSVSEVLRGIWSNMVSSMRAAVDSVIFGGEEENDENAVGFLSPPKVQTLACCLE